MDFNVGSTGVDRRALFGKINLQDSERRANRPLGRSSEAVERSETGVSELYD